MEMCVQIAEAYAANQNQKTQTTRIGVASVVQAVLEHGSNQGALQGMQRHQRYAPHQQRPRLGVDAQVQRLRHGALSRFRVRCQPTVNRLPSFLTPRPACEDFQFFSFAFYRTGCRGPLSPSYPPEQAGEARIRENRLRRSRCESLITPHPYC